MTPMMSFLVYVLAVGNAGAVPPPQDCASEVAAFTAASPAEILKEGEAWIPRLEAACPDFPKTLIAAKRKSLEPCKEASAACLEVVKGWQLGLNQYLEFQNSLKVLPEWARGWGSIAKDWWEYIKGLLG